MPANMAFNPLPWFFSNGGFHPELAPPLTEMLSAIKAAGYDAVFADVPPGSSPTEYGKVLSDHGLAPAPGYFQASFGDPASRPAVIETARALARSHAALGLDRIVLAEQFGVLAERMATPAQGVAADAARLQRITDGIGEAATAMTAEGVVPCLHLHVGTCIETVGEADTVLAGVPSSTLLVCPDTGHIAWTGADPAAFIASHAGRIGAMHVKDIHKSVATAVAVEHADYMAAHGRHIWTEPGRGDIDFDAVFAALDGFGGCFIVEVDLNDMPTVEESARVSAEFLAPRLASRR